MAGGEPGVETRPQSKLPQSVGRRLGGGSVPGLSEYTEVIDEGRGVWHIE